MSPRTKAAPPVRESPLATAADCPPPFQGSILRLMDLADMSGPTWHPWRAFWKSVYALPMDAADLLLFQRHTGRTTPPTTPAREVWQPIGRRGGKSRNAGLAAAFLAVSRDYRQHLAPGEHAIIPVIASDRQQAGQVLRFLKGLLTYVPELAPYVERELANSIDFKTGVTVQIATASYRTTRGYSVAGVIADEIAFWGQEEAAEPDDEILKALKPGMATIPGAMLIVLSTPYARAGELHRVVRDCYGKDIPDLLVWNADTLTMHPGDERIATEVRLAFESDPVAAGSEFGQDGKVVFRPDIESFVSIDAVRAVVVEGRRELLPERDQHGALRYTYFAFTDPSGGSADSWSLAIGHAMDGVPVLDAVREVQPPFSPAATVAGFVLTLRSYGITELQGDHYGGEFPKELFRKHGITYRPSDFPKSDLYREWLPLLNAGRLELLDLPRLKAQFCGLERKVARSGQESIDHAPGGHDDVANAVAGALVRAARQQVAVSVRFAL